MIDPVEMTVAYLAERQMASAYYDTMERQVRAKLRNCSTEELLTMLDKYDLRFAKAVRDKVGRGGWWAYPGGKIVEMKQLPDLDALKVFIQKLRNLDTGGSMVDSLRIMMMIAILEHLTRQLQGLMG